MAGATNSIRRVSRGLPKSPAVTPPPLSIAPRGNRSAAPTVNRASRIIPKDGQRDYAKMEDLPKAFDIRGIK